MDIDSVVIASPSSNARVFHQGAHVEQWTPQGQEPVVWVSQASAYQVGKSIRGGIPIIFPWFNQGRTLGLRPRHGFARTTKWEYLGSRPLPEGGMQATWFFDPTSAQEAEGADLFPYDYALHYRVSCDEALTVELEITNLSDEDFECELAFHTYLQVGDIERTTLEGLDGVEAVNPFISPEHFTQEGNVESLTGIDRVFFSGPNLTVRDEALSRNIQVESEGATNTIVWNPGPEGAAGMSDMGDDEWRQMLCVEAGCIYDNAIVVEPGRTHTLSYRLSTTSL
ncbi:D-hexose-6-phosphate mutarotase [Boudabousia marimammalium]|uniref:Putative glucose-6-phosphate 1-epimerase n=1 Tax=Boudabousia marimammalium TaxID=156892 RepID=A0A1Q5PRN5_9ACTO|nr:D-hexose-6-phosphate mutarotase [Boudabousia marimammalium]OKL50248.1 hypothetical protein BM477_02325 [Boudabousia marimammalium]